MSLNPEDQQSPEVLPYSTPKKSASVSVISVFTGIFLTFLGGGAVGVCCAAVASATSSVTATIICSFLGLIILLCSLAWLAWQRRRADRGLAIGICIGVGMMLMLLGVCLVGAPR